MTTDLFANRLHDVHFVNGIVRLEFCVAGRDDKGEFSGDAPVKPEDIHFTVNLPLVGFGRSMGLMRQFLQDLQQKGVLRKTEEEGSVEEKRTRLREKQASLVDLTEDSQDEEQPLV
jgi:hypothetical protein